MTTYEDIIYEERPKGVARITINRPASYNAFRGKTVEELIHAFQRAGWDKSIGVIVLTGAGDKAFCTGGDQGAHDGQYDGRGTIGLPIDEFQSVIRDMPKPVIARVNGFAIGGGNVLATICDLTIASDKAQFGQVGPKVGSVDPGFGTAYLARVVGEKKAREIWYLNRRYSAAQAVEMGLANIAVPHDELDAEVDRWCEELMERSRQHSRSPSVRLMRTRNQFAVSPAWAWPRSASTTTPKSRKRAAGPIARSASPTSASSPADRISQHNDASAARYRNMEHGYTNRARRIQMGRSVHAR